MPALGAAAVAIGLCCGIPVLLSAGVLTAVAGLGFESWLVLAIDSADAHRSRRSLRNVN